MPRIKASICLGITETMLVDDVSCERSEGSRKESAALTMHTYCYVKGFTEMQCKIITIASLYETLVCMAL